MTEAIEERSERGTTLLSSARFGAFSDAVVAIAMTLLILPLMEAIPESGHEAAAEGAEGADVAVVPTTVAWLGDHVSQVISLGISFVVIGMFWLAHHRIFRADTPHAGLRSTLNLAWLLTIVIMPITTALTGSVIDKDRPMLALYLGNLAVSAWLLLGIAIAELGQRRLHGLPDRDRTMLATPTAIAILYTVALLLGLLVPAVGYFWLFAMSLTGPLRALLVRLGLRGEPTPTG